MDIFAEIICSSNNEINLVKYGKWFDSWRREIS